MECAIDCMFQACSDRQSAIMFREATLQRETAAVSPHGIGDGQVQTV